MKLTLLLIPLICLASCTGDITSEIQQVKNQQIQEAKMNQYLTDTARYEATVRTMEQVKVVDDSGSPYNIYTGTLRWTSCGDSEEGENCVPPEFTMVMRDGVIIWFEESVSSLKCENIDIIEQVEVIDYIRNTQCVTDTGKSASIDVGSGFTLSQTEDNTTLSYSGDVVKVWPHTPPQVVPFVWDEACVIAWEGFEKLSSSELSGTGRQGVWDDLTEGEKKACMKEALERSIIVEAIDNRFFEIRRVFYEKGMYWVYDTQSKHIQELPTMGDISITASESGVLLVIDMAYGSDTMKLLYDADFSNLISQEKIPK